MPNFTIIRVAKLKTFGNIAASAQHTFRERPTHNADPSKQCFNYSEGAKSADEVVQGIKDRLAQIDVKDKQAAPCIEYLVTASPEMFEPGKKLDDVGGYFYFQDSLEWIRRKHGAENVVSAVVHDDETTPHMVVYVVPVVQREATTRKRSVGVKGGGRELKEFPVPARSELSAKHYFGDRMKLIQLQTDFWKEVGEKYGLKRGVHRGVEDERVGHQTIKEWYGKGLARAQEEIEALRANLEAREAKLNRWEAEFEEKKARNNTIIKKQKEAMAAYNAKVQEFAEAFKGFTHSQITEAVKRLDQERKGSSPRR